MELVLGNTLTHGTRGADTARDHLEQVVHIIGTTPLLMRDNIDLAFHLGLLDQLAVGTHAALRECLGELIRNQRRRVQTRECNELPAVAELGEPLDVGFLILGGHGGFPVEGG